MNTHPDLGREDNVCVRELSSEIRHVPHSVPTYACGSHAQTGGHPGVAPRGCVLGRWMLTTRDVNPVYHHTGPQLTGSWLTKMNVTSARPSVSGRPESIFRSSAAGDRHP